MWTESIIFTLFVCSVKVNFAANVMSKEDERYMRMLSYARLPGVKLQRDLRANNLRTTQHDEEFVLNLPKSFDPRDKWSYCPSLKEIRDQGKCGSCWALSTVAAITDRVCIHSNGSKRFHLSAEDLVTCSQIKGCKGGDPYRAWEYWVYNGIVTGGNHGSNQGCKPYSIKTCSQHVKYCTIYKPTPKCEHRCRRGYKNSYKKDKIRGKSAYLVQTEEQMMAELYENGPFTVSFQVFEDIANYTDGIYQHVHGKRTGTHAVKLMGWGEENDTKYWLMANSWGRDFGMNGFFKILRGSNECYIEEYEAAAGMPIEEDFSCTSDISHISIDLKINISLNNDGTNDL